MSFTNFRGTAEFNTVNGALRLNDVSGWLKGRTRNGSLHVSLGGKEWAGAGLDVETHNGAVHVSVPEGYSAELETATRRGRVDIELQNLAGQRAPGDWKIRLGAGGARVRAVTTNGSLTVRRHPAAT
jgi:DUF4097 and DUF4098 domain-containing protein YvlB